MYEQSLGLLGSRNSFNLMSPLSDSANEPSSPKAQSAPLSQPLTKFRLAIFSWYSSTPLSVDHEIPNGRISVEKIERTATSTDGIYIDNYDVRLGNYLVVDASSISGFSEIAGPREGGAVQRRLFSFAQHEKLTLGSYFHVSTKATAPNCAGAGRRSLNGRLLEYCIETSNRPKAKSVASSSKKLAAPPIPNKFDSLIDFKNGDKVQVDTLILRPVVSALYSRSTQEVGKALGGVSKNYLVPMKDGVAKGINESGREKQ
ncbi:hypothetical protein F5882DRAFT_437693 [Hyaloscypha sp. PMI_1271]|nr:hypothetical protein F5882DRAFT_437693 [Hyaloscypha sp. PMI_1271]